MSSACAHNILLKNYLFHKLDAKSGVIVLLGNADSDSKNGYQRQIMCPILLSGTFFSIHAGFKFKIFIDVFIRFGVIMCLKHRFTATNPAKSQS